MCIGSSPKAPTPPPVLPAAPTMPDVLESSAKSKGKDTRRRARGASAGGGQTSTILTGSRGVQTEAKTDNKTLLGG